MAHTGLRVGDALALTRDQALNGAPVIAQKTGKSNTLDLPESICRRVRRYMRPTDVYVFASRDARREGKPITRQTAAAAIHKAAAEIGYPEITCHSARKLFAYNLWRETGDIAAVQRAMQHSNLATTAIYLLSPRVG